MAAQRQSPDWANELRAGTTFLLHVLGDPVALRREGDNATQARKGKSPGSVGMCA
jgi:hypothetical protein